MASLEKIIKEKLNRLESVPNAFEAKTVEAQKTIFKDILKLLDRLDRKGDQIVINTKNLKLIDDIANKSRKIITDSEYFGAVKDLLSEMDTQAVLNNQYYQKVLDNAVIPSSATELLRFVKNSALDNLLGTSALTQEFSSPLKSILQKAVSSGASWSATIDNIRMITVGDQERLGLLRRYAGQIVGDTFNQADSSYANVLNEENGIEWYVYRGGVIRDTRDFCQERAGQYYHKNEIEMWADEEWQGKIPGTDSSSIFINRGGYNCRHAIMATSVFSVPEDVLLRNIENGNFNPSDALKSQLGI